MSRSGIKIRYPFLFISGIISLLFTGCNKLFEFSPYQANVQDSYKNTTEYNLTKLAETEQPTDSFSFAVITDSHYYFTELAAMVDHINQSESIQFVIFGGDIADQALLKEYEIFHEIMNQLNKPYFTVIGNHDYISNGELIYDQMFGAHNYSFEYANSKFILFDDIVWESNSPPYFEWLGGQLTNYQNYTHVFVAAHIPPSSDQFDETMQNTYRKLMSDHHVSVSIHGHSHRYIFNEYYNDGVVYLVVPSIRTSEYCIIKCTPDSVDIQLIDIGQIP
ncbi:MAG: metallophosphoesterase [Bacteroidetes bacterium]|nr:metallophosphoesterase [Bacteroidota bacterium]